MEQSTNDYAQARKPVLPQLLPGAAQPHDLQHGVALFGLPHPELDDEVQDEEACPWAELISIGFDKIGL